MRLFAVILLALVFLDGAAALDDLRRARAKVPRMDYRAAHPHDIGQKLNDHLRRSHQNVKPCHQWTPADLHELQATLHSHMQHAHNAIYQETNDTRALRFRSLEAHQTHWAKMSELANGHHVLPEMQRDGHCREAVMWWVHHLSQESRESLQHVTIPTLPLQEWRQPVADEGPVAAQLYAEHYNPSSTCLACHGGGIPWQSNVTQPPPIPRQANGKDRQRRCDEWYEGEAACGPCDGIAGAYWGDLPDDGIYPDCEVVAKPEDVPESDRAPTAWPHVFAVEMRGADRWPRASPGPTNASCGYTTDCSPYSKEAEGQPIPPSVPLHWYAAIHGVLYLDHLPGQFGGGRLRHETVYQFPSGKEGAERALQGLNGMNNTHLTEIHVQTPEMGAAGNPGVMLNLQHQNMTDWNASGHDDSKADWRRIPSTDGQCVCVPDPAGLPDFMGAYSNSTYKGRVTFIPPWQTTFTGGMPNGKKIVADHYVKWTFHMFVDIHTKMPAMFSSPYGGCATYGNWTMMPDEMWPGWRTNPPRNNCFDVTSNPNCKPYVQPSEIFL